MPVAWVIPFAVLLLCIAVLPLAKPHYWEHNKHKGIIATALSVPVVVWLLTGPTHGWHWLEESLELLGPLLLLGAVWPGRALAAIPRLDAAKPAQVLYVGAGR